MAKFFLIEADGLKTVVEPVPDIPEGDEAHNTNYTTATPQPSLDLEPNISLHALSGFPSPKSCGCLANFMEKLWLFSWTQGAAIILWIP